jgi:deazaflavin-dependent oxidoreductase (nitroreductase family)
MAERRMMGHPVSVTSSRDARKRRRVRALQRFVLNPPVAPLVWLGLVPGHVLIETRGRHSGKRRTTVVGMHIEDTTGWIVAEQGTHAGYVHNLQADPTVRVRVSRRWRPARAQLVPDDDPDARLESFGKRGHAAAVRRFGTSLSSIRVDFAGD